RLLLTRLMLTQKILAVAALHLRQRKWFHRTSRSPALVSSDSNLSIRCSLLLQSSRGRSTISLRLRQRLLAAQICVE
ncbi:hypothetical protein, partial [Phaeobacter sp. 11ANDIMAR09]|uniref:hypothetical protein n=1 Tax=Phaeobacter sp. 11ANDIMAR09 TaxID=1225647 RepID=UPI001C111B6C